LLQKKKKINFLLVFYLDFFFYFYFYFYRFFYCSVNVVYVILWSLPLAKIHFLFCFVFCFVFLCIVDQGAAVGNTGNTGTGESGTTGASTNLH
jgi:hypothetical protein